MHLAQSQKMALCAVMKGLGRHIPLKARSRLPSSSFEGSELPSYRAYAEGTCPNWESEEFVEVIGTSDERFAEMIPFWRAVVSNAEAFDNHIADVPQSSLLQDFRALVRTEPQRATKIISIMRIPIWGIWGAFDIQVEDPRDPAQDFGFLLRRGLLGW